MSGAGTLGRTALKPEEDIVAALIITIKQSIRRSNELSVAQGKCKTDIDL